MIGRDNSLFVDGFILVPLVQANNVVAGTGEEMPPVVVCSSVSSVGRFFLCLPNLQVGLISSFVFLRCLKARLVSRSYMVFHICGILGAKKVGDFIRGGL